MQALLSMIACALEQFCIEERRKIEIVPVFRLLDEIGEDVIGWIGCGGQKEGRNVFQL